MNIVKAFIVSLVFVFAGCSSSDNQKSETDLVAQQAAQTEWDSFSPGIQNLNCKIYNDLKSVKLTSTMFPDEESKELRAAKIAVLQQNC